MTADSELRQFVLVILETLRRQVPLIFENHLKVQALEKVVNADPRLAELYREAMGKVRTPEAVRNDEAIRQGLDMVIRQIHGQSSPGSH